MKEKRKAEEKLDVRNRLEKGEWIVNNCRTLCYVKSALRSVGDNPAKIKERAMLRTEMGAKTFTKGLRLK